MGTTDAPPEKDRFAELSIYYHSELSQLRIWPIPPLDEVYQLPHGSGTVGKSWEEHHKALAELVQEIKPNRVLEIGGGNGRLFSYAKQVKFSQWLIVDPNPTVEETDRLVLRRGFFDSKLLELPKNERPDLIIHSHVLEHVEDPLNFLIQIEGLLANDGVMLFSVPNFDAMLDRNYINWLNFEHLHYLGITQLLHILDQTGFKVKKMDMFRDDHSVFLHCTKDSVQAPINVKDFISSYG